MITTNAMHNIGNALGWVISGGTLILMASGCKQDAAGGYDCTGSMLTPEIALGIVGAIAFAKQIINWQRDGFTGMFKEQPPVKEVGKK